MTTNISDHNKGDRAALTNGLTWRQIAELIWGAERVAEEWWPGGWMHGRVKRRLEKARAMLKGYRDIAAG